MCAVRDGDKVLVGAGELLFCGLADTQRCAWVDLAMKHEHWHGCLCPFAHVFVLWVPWPEVVDVEQGLCQLECDQVVFDTLSKLVTCGCWVLFEL